LAVDWRQIGGVEMKCHQTVIVSTALLFCTNSALAISMFDLTYGEDGYPDPIGGGEPFVVGDLTFFEFDDAWENVYEGPGVSVPSMEHLEVSPLGEGTNRQGLLFAGPSFFTGMGNPLDWDYGGIHVVSSRRIARFSIELLSYFVYDAYEPGSPLIEFGADFRPEGAAELIATDAPEQSVLSGDLYRDVRPGDEVEFGFDLRLNGADAAELGVSSWAVYFTLVPEPSTMGMAIVTAIFSGLVAAVPARRRLTRR
jgi:hypothetical protein